jgi:hypothetical protein
VYHLSQLFVKAYEILRYTWDETQTDPQIGHGAYVSIGQSAFDISKGVDASSAVELSDLPDGTGANQTPEAEERAPVIVSVGNCIGTECYEGKENAFSLENQTSGDITAMGSKQVDVNFFVYAQPNQMPLRNIIVDWGDDFAGISSAIDALPWPTGSQSGSTANNNFYKNYRGLDSVGDPECDDGDEWGKTSATCATSYVSFSHAYLCTAGQIEQYAARECEYDPDTGRLVNSPCIENGSCVFQPRVYAVDNWEWCTGTCEAGEDGTSECWGKKAECNFAFCPSENLSNDCVDKDAGKLSNPWINYDGYIILEPD